MREGRERVEKRKRSRERKREGELKEGTQEGKGTPESSRKNIVNSVRNIQKRRKLLLC